MRVASNLVASALMAWSGSASAAFVYLVTVSGNNGAAYGSSGPVSGTAKLSRSATLAVIALPDAFVTAPEPASLALLMASFGGIGCMVRARRRAIARIA